MNRRIVLLGPPAAGKGMQAALIHERYGLPIMSMGAVVRRETAIASDLGVEAGRYASKGRLFPDWIALGLVERWINRVGVEFVFDGFPRTLSQAEGLSKLLAGRNLSLGAAIVLVTNEETIRERVSRRMVCENCDLVVSVGVHVPSSDSKCPKCMGALKRREDDTPEALENRMIEYRARTEPLIEYYRQQKLLVKVDSEQTPEVVFRKVSEIVESI
jgi:adenylate kinase